MTHSANPNHRSRSGRRWAAYTGLLLAAFVGIGLVGCNPQALSMLLMPWFDNKEPAECKIADPKKETTVAIVTWFGNPALETSPDLMPIDSELSDQLAKILRDRYQGNKEKV